MLNLIRHSALVFALSIGGAQAAPADPAVDYFRAVQIDNVDTVRSLLAGKVTPNIVEPNGGESGLILALREDAMRVFAALLADPRTDIELNARNSNTALMMAAFKRNKPAVLALLAKGAQVNRAGWTALHYAAASGDDEIVAILLDHHAAIDAPSPSQITPLMIAAREGHDTTALALLAAGADPTRKNNEGLTALQIAERADRPYVVRAIQARLGGAKPPKP